MSDHEFNGYLALLASLLRLDARQRRAIAEELRTHLEDRLEELLARGVSRDEAIQQALSEFGDAAGLAAQFASISRGRRRRWLMRAMTFSVAAMLLVAAGLAIFWPGRNAGPGRGQALAQNQADKQAAEPKREPPPLRERTLEDVLSQRMDLEFTESPLSEVAAELAERTGITFHLNAKALNDAGVAADTPVTIHFRNLRLSTMLDLMLAELELTYTEHENELIVITTPESVESHLENRVYDCRDLLAMEAPAGSEKFVPRPFLRQGMGGMGGGGMFAVQDEPPGKTDPGKASTARQPAATAALGGNSPGDHALSSQQVSVHELRVDRLIELITANVRPDTWDDIGGPGAISEYNGLIVVAQTVHVHKEVEHVLNMLRQAAGLDIDKNGKAKVVR